MTLLLALLATAQADTIAVVTTVTGDAPADAVDAMAWHALYSAHGHDALALGAIDESTPARLHEHAIETLLAVEVRWAPQPHETTTGMVTVEVPVLGVRELGVADGALVERRAWEVRGEPAVFAVDGRWVALPELALGRAMERAMAPVAPPAWGAVAEPLRVPVVIVADEEFRAAWGDGWWEVAARRIGRASAMLAPSGLGFEIVGYQTWDSPAAASDLAALLEGQAALPTASPGALRIGFTSQVRLGPPWEGTLEDVGRARLPGRDVIIADQPLLGSGDSSLDEAEEGVAVVHEVLHALGIPHRGDASGVMAATHTWSTHLLDEGSLDLARTAAQARWAHWDPVAATAALGIAAERWLTDPEAQLDYVGRNLELGIGVPAPGALRPDELGAVVDLALKRCYKRQQLGGTE